MSWPTGVRAHNYSKEYRVCKSCDVKFLVSPSAIGNFCSNNCKYADTSKRMSDDNHHQWKGDKAGYNSLHKWVARKLGKPEKCEDCGITGDRGLKRNYHWSNVSGNYKRELKDWKRLCVPCHSKFDHSRKDNRYATSG